MEATSVSAVWPLTGREEELRLITESLGEIGEYGGVAIIGRAGVGKSRLAREAAAASGAGATVRWTAGTQSAQTIPLGAFAQWATDIDGGALQLVGSVINALTTPAGSGRAVVAVDDAHLLDDLSATVLHQLVLREAASVIVTIRSGEPVSDAVTALWKDGYLRLLELQPLSRSESDILLGSALAGNIDPDGARRMWELAGGNVLYLRHLVAQETATQRLVHHAGTWRWTGMPVVSPTLIDLIKSQVGAVAPRCSRQWIWWRSLNRSTSFCLSALVDPTAVEDAERRGLVTVTPSGGEAVARIGHPLYGEVRRKQAVRCGCDGCVAESHRSWQPVPTSTTPTSFDWACCGSTPICPPTPSACFKRRTPLSYAWTSRWPNGWPMLARAPATAPTPRCCARRLSDC